MKHTHGKRCSCSKCQVNITGKTKVNKHIQITVPSEDTWKEYDAEFSDIIFPLQVELESGQIIPEQAASKLNTLLTTFLTSKPNLLKEVKTYFRHKPSAMSNLNDARKLKNELEKKSRQKGATVEDEICASKPSNITTSC